MKERMVTIIIAVFFAAAPQVFGLDFGFRADGGVGLYLLDIPTETSGEVDELFESSSSQSDCYRSIQPASSLPPILAETFEDGTSSSSSSSSDSGAVFLILPVLDMGLYVQGASSEATRFGAGLRIFSWIVLNAGYPNLFFEHDAGHFTFRLQCGGGAIVAAGGVVGMAAGYAGFAPFLIPDASVYFRIDNLFRIGGGAMLPMVFDSEKTYSLLVPYLAAAFTFSSTQTKK